MALIECVECGQQISDQAEFCPHCGRPTGKKPKQVQYQYKLRLGSATSNSFAGFLKFCSIVALIGGLIISFLAARREVTTYRYSTETVFSWSIFITTFLPYLESCFVLWSMGKIVEMIQATHDMVAGLKLEATEKADSPASANSSKPTPYMTAGRTALDGWRCKKCGTNNSYQDINCKNCGEYR
ncbi:MAG: zinc ribbon domain-containing protein [Clostridia bacterium]|nr:zinc ribbon domain-containing protein [Clostridia bacterium]